EKSGLDNTVSQIFEDDYGYLWLGTGRGILSIEKKQFLEQMNGIISKFDPQVFNSSDMDQPLSPNAGIFPAGCKLPDGTLWFPTNHGIAVMYPDSMHGKIDFPRVVIQEVDVNHNRQPLSSSYTFPPAVIHLEIKFTAPTFISPDLIRFRYKLVGYDDDWVYPKGRTAYFTKIPHGSYEFQVQVSNRMGQWSDQIVKIPIRIKPFFHQTIWFLVLCILLGLFLIYAIVRYRIRQIREKELEVLVDERTRELRELNRELDQRVLDRTAELAASNQELEAFSYSVSHDLRAPVRRIDGLIQAVMEDYAPQLDQTGRDFLGKIEASAVEMNQLIDEFLKLARIARQEINKTDISLSDLASEVVEELSKTDPDRKVDVVIQPGMTAAGDSRLIRIALHNLLGNAWKYTGKNPSAKIEFSCREDEKQKVYFIRDNGVGFDMGHYEKLFTPFMRLHSDDQFTGTGIGLATVKRIMLKHGGKIWAQSEPGKGSTFFFTL
ncbi:MAG: ATP-binding protein, partial [bacterium]